MLRLSPIIPFGVNNSGCTGIKRAGFSERDRCTSRYAYCNVGAQVNPSVVKRRIKGCARVADHGRSRLCTRIVATRALAQEGIGEDKDVNDKKN